MKCEVTPMGLLARIVESFISNGGHLILSRRTFLSLTELTELTERFHQRFEPTEGLRHTEVTEAFQLTLAVTFCVIG